MRVRRARSQGMNRPTALLLLLASILISALAVPAAARACSCIGPGSNGGIPRFYAQQIKRADAAIVARVRAVKPARGNGGPAIDQARFVLDIDRSFKKRRRFHAGATLRLRASTNGAACGLELHEGDRTGLLLYRYRGRLTANLCGEAPPKWLRRGARYLRSHRHVRRAHGLCGSHGVA